MGLHFLSAPPDSPARMTIIVSTCDLFFDAWIPFFQLLRKFWPDCRFPVVLITNHLRLDEGPVRAMELGDDRGWSNNLITTLERLDTPYAMYMQEDHFLLRTVHDQLVRRALDLADERQLDFIAFRARQAARDSEKHPDLPFHFPANESGEGIFCDPSIWRRESLLALLAPDETAWNFLKAGRRRVAERGYRRAQCDLKRLDQCPIHYIKRSGIREFLWHPRALPWLWQNGVQLWPPHRGILLQSMHLRRAVKKEPDNRWLRWRYSGFGIGSTLTRWQRQISMAHVRRYLRRDATRIVPLHQALDK